MFKEIIAALSLNETQWLYLNCNFTYTNLLAFTMTFFESNSSGVEMQLIQRQPARVRSNGFIPVYL